MKTFLAGVIAMTLTAFAVPSFADEPKAPTPAVSAAPVPVPAAEGTPLAPRPSKPLALAPASDSTPWGYKLLTGAALAAAAGLWLRNRRRGLGQSAKPKSSIDVLGRTSVGVRNELLVVDVEGTRLLVGMTPSSINTLAVLQTPEDEGVLAPEAPELAAAARTARPELPASSTGMLEIGERVRSLFDDRASDKPVKSLKAEPRRSPPRAARAALPKASRIAGQAKGLLLALDDADQKSEL